jgi:hypothetical protein
MKWIWNKAVGTHFNILSWFMGVWLQKGYGLDTGFIDQNYTTTVKIHNSQITTAPANPFSSLLCLQQPFPRNGFNSWDSSASRAHVVTVRRLSHSWSLSAGVGFSLYSLGAAPTENTASNNPSIVVMDACLAIAWISFPQERVYRAVAQKRMFLLAIFA